MRAMERLQPQHGPVVPDPKWVQEGVMPDGRILWREEFLTAESVPDIDEETGLQRQRLTPFGQPLGIGVRKPKKVTKVRTFVIESQGNFNQEKVFCRLPTKEELLEAERRAQLATFKDEFFERLFDRMGGAMQGSQLSAEDMLTRMFEHGPTMTPDEYRDAFDEEPQAVVEADTSEFPARLEPAEDGTELWGLSGGQVFAGTEEEAVTAQEQINESLAQQGEVPSF